MSRRASSPPETATRGQGEVKVGTKMTTGGFSGGTVAGNLPTNAGDTGSSPGTGRSHMLWSN